jgi:hypothetical protein
LSGKSIICDILSFKAVHLNYHDDNKLDMILFKKSPFTEFRRRLSCSQKSPTNSCNESNTSNPKRRFHFTNTDFCIIFKSVWGSIVNKVTRIYPGTSLFKYFHEQYSYLFSRISRPAPGPTEPPSPVFSLAVKWLGQTTWPLTSVESEV